MPEDELTVKIPWWRQTIDFILELIKVTVICAVVIISVRWFLFQPFYVKGESMEPNYFDGEYLIIYQLPYRFPDRFHKFTEADRGQTLVIHPPNEPDQFYIKRLIGLPGERIVIDKGGIIIFNSSHPGGFSLEENYLSVTTETLSGSYNDIQLGLDEVFVLGDNRTRSLDSRSFGPISKESVIGEPVLRGWPWERFGLIHDH